MILYLKAKVAKWLVSATVPQLHQIVYSRDPE
jgi:hypothetical protein